MATFTKDKQPFCGMKTVSENVCLSGRKVGNVCYRIGQGEQPSTNRHEAEE